MLSWRLVDVLHITQSLLLLLFYDWALQPRRDVTEVTDKSTSHILHSGQITVLIVGGSNGQHGEECNDLQS